ncbi:MAG: NAD-dependent epimerase/dehydratase family protein [Proteobacteria bacterium]|nr:NAD-dependent epimerase/dehydratase family protein [Pseudomonadota bacterium]
MKGRKVVLTGGTGLIMSNVAERHADMGDEVVLFDNNQQHDMYEETQKLLKEKTNVTFVKGDIRDAKAVAEVAKGAEIFYHFAALMGTSSRFKQEVITTEVNVIGTINACQAALDAGVKYYVYPPRPALTVWLTPYIITKTASTQFTQMYNVIYGLPTIGFNIANCYGPRERAVLEANAYKPGEGRKMMATFIEAALKNEDLPVMGDGEQSSDFVFIEDVVEAIMRAPRDVAIGQIMDIGTGINTPVKKVAEMIIEITGSKSKIKYMPLRTGEVKVHTKADNANAKKYLDWEPKVDLREGIKRTIPYYAKRLGVKSPV